MKKDTNLFLKYVGPSVIGMLIGGSFSIVDTIFIGQASGKTGLAAVALPLCLYTLPLWFGIDGVWLSMPASRVILMILLLYFWFGTGKKQARPA